MPAIGAAAWQLNSPQPIAGMARSYKNTHGPQPCYKIG